MPESLFSTARAPSGAYWKDLPAVICSLAVVSVALFGHTEGLTIIPQAISALAVGLAIPVLFVRLPRFHIAVLAFTTLLAYWGTTITGISEEWVSYQSLIKMYALALAAHVTCRSERHLLLLFGAYSATGLINVALNWGDLKGLAVSAEVAGNLADKDRFAGTFGNANTAGIYATTALLLAVIFFYGSKRWLRWLVLLSGGLGGIAILYFTGSRKAMLALGLTAMFIPWMGAQQGGPGQLKWLKWSLLCAATVALCALLFSQLPYTERLFVQFRDGVHAEASSHERADMVEGAVELWWEYPLFGCGFDGFARLSGFQGYSHSTFTEVLCNGGIFGMVLVGIFYGLPGYQLIRITFLRLKPSERSLHIGLLGLWLQFVLFCLFAVMWYNADNLCLFMAMCGYLQEKRWLRTGEVRAPLLARQKSTLPEDHVAPSGALRDA